MPTISLHKKHARSISSFNPVGVNDFNSKIQKPLFVTIFYHSYHLSYVKDPSQCPGIWNQKKNVLQTQNDEKPEKYDPVSW